MGKNLNAWEIVLAGDESLYLVITHNTQFKNGEIQPDLLDGEIYRSTDQGENWQVIELPAAVRFPNSLSVDPGNPQRLLNR